MFPCCFRCFRHNNSFFNSKYRNSYPYLQINTQKNFKIPNCLCIFSYIYDIYRKKKQCQVKRNFYTEIESALGIPKDQRTYKPYVFEKPTSKPTPNETKENEAVFDVESVAKDNDTEESIKEKLKNPFGKKVVIEGVEYTITDVGRGAGSPDITLTDKDGNIFYEEQKTFDGRIIKKLPTKSTLIDIAKNQKPTENLAEQAAETPEQSIKEIELKRDSDVRELSKYRIEINLPTIKEIVNSKDPIGNKWKYSAIKEKITMLDKLINCL